MMGFKLTVVGESGESLYEFSHLTLPTLISTLFNHQKKLKPERCLTLEGAEKIIQGYEGSHEIRLDLARNHGKKGHKRHLGLLIKGTWNDDVFTPHVVMLNQADFEKGRVRSGVHKIGKTKKDTKPLSDLIQIWQEQERHISETEARSAQDSQSEAVSPELEVAHAQSQAEDIDKPGLGTPPLVVSSLEESSEEAEHSDFKKPARRSSVTWAADPVAKVIEEDSDVFSASSESQAENAARSLHAEMAHKAHIAVPAEEAEAEDSLMSKVESSGKTTRRHKHRHHRHHKHKHKHHPRETDLAKNSTDDERQAQTLMQHQTSGWLSSLITPSLSAGLVYGIVRALDALKWVTLAAVGSVSAMYAGIAFVVTGIFQWWRNSFKKSSFEQVTNQHETVEEVTQDLSLLDEKQWQALRHGFDAQGSLLSQFKSSLTPSDYANARHYYAGSYLRECEPNFDLDSIENKRARPS